LTEISRLNFLQLQIFHLLRWRKYTGAELYGSAI